MTTPIEPPEPEPDRPAALRTRPQILAIIAIVLAALVPIAMAFGLPVCPVLEAVGVHLDACQPPSPPVVDPTPPPAPEPPPSEPGSSTPQQPGPEPEPHQDQPGGIASPGAAGDGAPE